MPTITLPDGSQKKFDQPVTVAEVASSIGAGLAKAAIAGRVDDKLVDTSFVIENDAKLSIVTEKDPAALDVIRHSTAHLLAMAVQAVYPKAQVTIGPVIEDGFFYDFAFERPFTPEDLEKFEAKMKEIAAADLKVTRRGMDRDAAEKRDHRRIGKELDLFHFQEEAPGAVFWHPKGWKIFQQLIAYMRKRQDEAGYGEVNAPEIMESSLWQKSGHLEKFGENMFLTK